MRGTRCLRTRRIEALGRWAAPHRVRSAPSLASRSRLPATTAVLDPALSQQAAQPARIGWPLLRLVTTIFKRLASVGRLAG